MDISPFGQLDIWRFGRLGIWTFGHLEIWTFGTSGKRVDKLTKGEETQRQHFAESEIKISDHHIDAMVHCSALQEWVLDNQEVKSEEKMPFTREVQVKK